MMGILVVVFVIETLAGGSENPRVLDQPRRELSARWSRPGEYWRLFTANFLHIGLMHIAFNLYALYIVGTEVEMFYGPWRFLVIYLLSGLSGAIASYAFTYGLSAGASTAVFGLIGTLFAFFTRNRAVFGEMSRTRLTNLIVVIAINVFYGLSVGTIDNWGHVGGFIGGVHPRLAVVPVLSDRSAARWAAPRRRSQFAAPGMDRRGAGGRAHGRRVLGRPAAPSARSAAGLLAGSIGLSKDLVQVLCSTIGSASSSSSFWC